MEHSLWPIFIVNIGINSLFSFFTLSILVLLTLKLLQIRNARVQAVCLFIPFIKLIVDLGTYQFSNWALAQGINPLTLPEGSRMLNATFMLPPFLHLPLCSIDCYIQEGQTFTFADLFCLAIGPAWTLGCAGALISGALFFLARAVQRFQHSRQWFQKMVLLSERISPTFQDVLLQERLMRKKVILYLSHIPHAPCIYSQRTPAIFIPHALFEQLTVQEFEAIIAHEISHLEQGDLMANAFLFWILPFFWWIPMGYMKRTLELVQEMACDRLHRTNLERTHLADALFKASHWLHALHLPPFARPFATPHQVVKRIKALVGMPQNE